MAQRGLDFAARDPAARNHGAEPIGLFVERFVAAAGGSLCKFLSASLERSSSISALANRCFTTVISSAGVVVGFVLTVRFLAYDFFPAVASHDFGRGVKKCGRGLDG